MREYRNREIFSQALGSVLDAVSGWVGISFLQAFTLFGMFYAALFPFLQDSCKQMSFLVRIHQVDISSCLSGVSFSSSIVTLISSGTVFILSFAFFAASWTAGAFFALQPYQDSIKSLRVVFWGVFWRYWARSFVLSLILFFLIVGASFVLVIPGIYLLVRLQFAYFCLVTYDCSARNAIILSWRMTSGASWKLFWTLFLLFCFAGFFCTTGWFMLFVFPCILSVQAAIFRALSAGQFTVKESASIFFKNIMIESGCFD